MDTSRVSVRDGERDSVLFVREAQRADSGRYQLTLQLGGLEDTATIDILVVGMMGWWKTGRREGSPPRAGVNELSLTPEYGTQ